MLPFTSRGWLIFAAKFALSLIFVLPLTVLLSTTGAHAQQAKLGPISIRSVYTTDAKQNNKTHFAPGDSINYHVDVDNNTGNQIPVDVELQVLVNNFNPYDYLQTYSYKNSFHVDEMPVGLTRFYTPETIPHSSLNAVPGDYSIRITVTPSDSASPANDGDWGEGDFAIPEDTVHKLIGEDFKCIVGLPAVQKLLSKLGTGGKILAFVVDKVDKGGTVFAVIKDIQTSNISDFLLDLTGKEDCFRFLQDFSHVLVEPLPDK